MLADPLDPRPALLLFSTCLLLVTPQSKHGRHQEDFKQRDPETPGSGVRERMGDADMKQWVGARERCSGSGFRGGTR